MTKESVKIDLQKSVEYKDDVFIIPRNTSIIVRRLPASRPGKGTAQRYVLGALPADGKGMGTSGIGMMKGSGGGASGGHHHGPPAPGSAAERFSNSGRSNMVLNAPQYRNRPQQQQLSPTPSQMDSQSSDTATPSTAPADDSEEARIQAMFQQTTDQWGAMQEKLAE